MSEQRLATGEPAAGTARLRRWLVTACEYDDVDDQVVIAVEYARGSPEAVYRQDLLRARDELRDHLRQQRDHPSPKRQLSQLLRQARAKQGEDAT